VAAGPARDAAAAVPATTARLDKWLWHARFFRSRSLAVAEVAAGHVRINGVKVAKPAHPLRAGDTLTFPQGSRIRVVRVTGTSLRRGPAEAAQRLYADLDSSVPEPPETA
jgi:ribosome-associated heat shock protein Hsp15